MCILDNAEHQYLLMTLHPLTLHQSNILLPKLGETWGRIEITGRNTGTGTTSLK